jgi:hypothetical protein
MGRRGKLTLFGLSLVVAALGVALLVAGPATAGDPPAECEAGTQQGMVTDNLGV